MSDKKKIATKVALPPLPATKHPDWISVPEAAGEVDYCERVIYQLIATYDISQKKRGRRRVYRPALIACIEMQTRS